MLKRILFLLLLTFTYHLQLVAQSAETSRLADKILAIQDKIIQEGKTTNQLSEKDLASLPVGIPKDIGGITYWVIIDSARFTPQGAFFNAYITFAPGRCYHRPQPILDIETLITG
jgi:hypothetical protein